MSGRRSAFLLTGVVVGLLAVVVSRDVQKVSRAAKHKAVPETEAVIKNISTSQFRDESTPRPKIDSPGHLGTGLAQSVIDQMLPRYTKLYGKTKRSEYSLFGRDHTLGLTEARLVATVDPESVEKIAAHLAFDETQPFLTRSFGAQLLAYLAQSSRASSGALLVRLSDSHEEAVRQVATYGLLSADIQGAHLQTYMNLSRVGDPASFRALAKSSSPAVADLMRTLMQSTSVELSGVRYEAEDCLKRVQILQSPSWKESIWGVLQDSFDRDDSEWALAIARARPEPSFVQTLRKRLDMSLEVMKRKYLKEQADDAGAGLPGAQTSFEKSYTTLRIRSAFPDVAYDEALLTFFQLGGSPTPLELRRLQHFGYACDPQSRLRELLDTK